MKLIHVYFLIIEYLLGYRKFMESLSNVVLWNDEGDQRETNREGLGPYAENVQPYLYTLMLSWSLDTVWLEIKKLTK